MRQLALAGFGVAVALVLAGCNLTAKEDQAQGSDPYQAVQNLDLLPRYANGPAAASGQARGAKAQTYPGQDTEGGLVRASEAGPAVEAPNGEGFELNFEDASIATVAKVIIGDILHAGYTIDPRIQGTVTIASGRPIPQDKLLHVLEGALRMSNAILVADGANYRILPAGEANSAGLAHAGRGEPGFGVTAVPLRYTSAATILKLLDSFSLRPGSARADDAKNMILVQGSGPERKAALQTILDFDVDWMRGQSVGVYPLQSAAPEAIIVELKKIMHSADGEPNAGLIDFQPVARLNAVLVVTKRKDLLSTAGTWVKRLDRSDNPAVAVRVYRLRYGNASQVAKLLNEVFAKSSESGLEAPQNSIAPGSGILSSAARQVPGFGTQQQSSSTGTSLVSGLGSTSSMGTGSGSGLGLGSSSGTATQNPFRAERPITSPGAVGGDTDQDTGGRSKQLLLGGVRIAADVANNALLIYANQENYKIIEQTLIQLDRPQLQVAIHATIAEVTLNNKLGYGVQFFLQSSDLKLGKDNGSALLTNLTQAAISRVLPGYNLLLGPEGNPRVILDALRDVTDVKVLSNPTVVVMDNQAATLQVGDQVPITTQSATILTNPNTPLVNTIDYRNTGIILQVLPRVNANGNVILDISQEISNVVENTATTNTLTPTISQRKIRSSIAVASGQTVLLAGLISDNQQRERAGVPVLEELPAVGDAFSHNTRKTQRTELIMFIQPQIIRDSVDAYKVAEELRVKLQGPKEAYFPPGPSLQRFTHP